MPPRSRDDFDMVRDEDGGGGTLNQILIHVGETRAGIDALKTDIGDVKEDLSKMQASVIKKPECTERHKLVAMSINGVSQQLNRIEADIKTVRSQTGDKYPAVGRRKLLTGETAANKRDARYWLELVGKALPILAFLGSVFWGIVSLGRYMEKVDQTIEASRKDQIETRKELKQVVQQIQISNQPEPTATPAESSKGNFGPAQEQHHSSRKSKEKSSTTP